MEKLVSRRGRKPKNNPYEVLNVPQSHIEDDFEEQNYLEQKSIPRAEVRPPLRELSPKERARMRASELRGNGEYLNETTDEFYIPEHIVPDGWVYEWKRRTVLGYEDPSHMLELASIGWEAVPTSRHPEMMPVGSSSQTIERKGMILMELPKEISDERRARERRKAVDQVRAKEAQLSGTPDGTLTRDHERVKPRIRKEYAMPIPEDEN